VRTDDNATQILIKFNKVYHLHMLWKDTQFLS